VAQLGVATLSLTWQLTQATDSATPIRGDVFIPYMNNFYEFGNEGADERVDQLYAHT